MDSNVIIDIVSAIIVGVALATEKIQNKADSPDLKLLRLLMLCLIMVLLTDIPGLWLDGAQGSGAKSWIWFFDTLYWLCHSAYGWLWLMFVDYLLFHSKERLHSFKWVYAVPMLAEIVMVATNPFTKWIFVIDDLNRYEMGDGYYYNLLPYFIYFFASAMLIVNAMKNNRETDVKRRCMRLSTVMVLPLCGVLLEVFAYGVSWVWPLTMLSLLMVYVDMQQQRILDERLRSAKEKEKAALLQKQLTETRIKIMLSQIQPHFLFNSLAVIQVLCEMEPATAAVAMKRFSDFLRGNMDSLTMDKLISFDLELNHTKNYLALEKLRFEDAINIEYKIETTVFRLPTLTLQPIVENAVRYGITKREEGGTVIISTSETGEAFVITVEDDGIGFDVREAKSDGRAHIGIENVRNRLHEMCGGSLELNSTLGQGTTATITIPKEGDGI